MRHQACPICSSTSYREALTIPPYQLCKCLSCSVIFLTPRPHQSQALETNKDTYDGQKTLDTYETMADKFLARARRQVRTIQEILQKKREKPRVLDVGCSYGYALSVFMEHGYEPYGIDISPNAVRFVKEHHGIPAQTVSFEDFATKKRFDVITMFDVIEHFADPCAAVKKAYDLLSPGGVLLIQTPNYDSLIRRLTGKHWYWLLVPWHLTLFTPLSLRQILTEERTPPTPLFAKEGEMRFDGIRLSTWDDMYEVGSNLLDMAGLKREGRYKKWHRRLAKIIEMTEPLSRIWNWNQWGGELEVYAIKK